MRLLEEELPEQRRRQPDQGKRDRPRDGLAKRPVSIRPHHRLIARQANEEDERRRNQDAPCDLREHRREIEWKMRDQNGACRQRQAADVHSVKPRGSRKFVVETARPAKRLRDRPGGGQGDRDGCEKARIKEAEAKENGGKATCDVGER